MAYASVENSSDLFDGDDDLEDHDLRASEISWDQHEDPRRYSCGLTNVDDSAGLIRPGELVIVGAREGEGKTAFIEGVALENADEHRVLFASLDMEKHTVRDRLLCKCMLMGDADMRLSMQQNDRDFQAGMSILKKRDIMLWTPETPKEQSIAGIIERAERLTAAILIVDYSALIQGWQPGQEARAIVDRLTKWTHRTRTTTFLLTQLKDEAVNKRPNNGHIQDTTRIAQRADRVILIYRPFSGNIGKDKIAEITHTKNRFGPKVRNHAGWTSQVQNFYALDGEEEAHAKCCYRPPKK